MKIIYEDGEELECSNIVISGNWVYADDLYQIHIADCKEIVDDVKDNELVQRLKNHDRLDIDYCDNNDMWELVKYNAYDDEWKSTGIYADKKWKAQELITNLEKK